jgi:RNA polymerase-interacting CarD/CdnL/TRCF family regulator
MSGQPPRLSRSSVRETASLNVDRDPVAVAVAVSEPPLDLRVGALVVYGGHGLGRVSRTRDGGGDDASSSGGVVLEFASSGLSVTLPLERAVSCLRSVADAGVVARVRDALHRRDASIEPSWVARRKSTRAKLIAGEAVGLAEIVRDAFTRRLASPSGALSSSEREFSLKARRLLAAELGAAMATDDARAEAWIDGELEASSSTSARGNRG